MQQRERNEKYKEEINTRDLTKPWCGGIWRLGKTSKFGFLGDAPVIHRGLVAYDSVDPDSISCVCAIF